jgi:hydrogenase nickel incorporation protein HypA/HybF
MHEFSIAQNIIEIVEETIRASNKKKVTCVELEVGNFRVLRFPALETAIDCIAPGSVLEGSRVQINVIRGTAVCRNAGIGTILKVFLTPLP